MRATTRGSVTIAILIKMSTIFFYKGTPSADNPIPGMNSASSLLERLTASSNQSSQPASPMTNPSSTNVNLQGVNLTSLPNSINGLQNVQVSTWRTIRRYEVIKVFQVHSRVNCLSCTTGVVPRLVAAHHDVVKCVGNNWRHRHTHRGHRFPSHIVRHEYLYNRVERWCHSLLIHGNWVICTRSIRSLLAS